MPRVGTTVGPRPLSELIQAYVVALSGSLNLAHARSSAAQIIIEPQATNPLQANGEIL